MRLNNLSMYEIMSDGNIFSYYSNRYLKPMKSWDGKTTTRVHLTTDSGERKWFYVSKLIMLAFGPAMPVDKPFVFHIDHDLTNNDINNLIWVDDCERAKGERYVPKRRVPMKVYYHGEYVCSCRSANQAKAITHLSHKVILKHMRYGTTSVNGYSFEEIK